MSHNRFTLAVSGALVALVLGTAAATAGGAVASTVVNVRAGPGSGFPVIDVLGAGQRVRVDHCRGPWCLIRQPGPDGWVDANYITTRRHYRNHGYTENVEHDAGHYAGGYYGGENHYDEYSYLERPHHRYSTYSFYGDVICIKGSYAKICARD
jgi:uncharacterized protein YraI